MEASNKQSFDGKSFVEFHFIMSIAFLPFTKLDSIGLLYEAIRTANCFIAYYAHASGEHLHLILQERIISKGRYGKRGNDATIEKGLISFSIRFKSSDQDILYRTLRLRF